MPAKKGLSNIIVSIDLVRQFFEGLGSLGSSKTNKNGELTYKFTPSVKQTGINFLKIKLKLNPNNSKILEEIYYPVIIRTEAEYDMKYKNNK